MRIFAFVGTVNTWNVLRHSWEARKEGKVGAEQRTLAPAHRPDEVDDIFLSIFQVGL